MTDSPGTNVAAADFVPASGGQWFYQRIWSRTEPPAAASLEPTTWLLFMDSLGLGRQIAEQLKGAEHGVIEVHPAKTFARLGKRKYCIRPGRRADYDSLIVDITKRGSAPQKIVHLWSVRNDSPPIPIDSAIDRTFHSILYFAQALGKQDLGRVEFAAISHHLQSVSAEPLTNPVRGTLFGPIKLMPQIFNGMKCRAIDCDPFGQGTSYVALQVITELCSPSSDAVIAYRGDERWVESFSPLEFQGRSKLRSPKEAGVYLITGGLGQLGLAIAEDLAINFHARLVLVDNAELPPRAGWQDALRKDTTPEHTKRLITRCAQLRELGADVITICADVAKPDEMKTAVELASGRFGAIDGVIYGAGVIDETSEQAEARFSEADIFDSRIKGVLTLKELLRGKPLDFFALLSCRDSTMSALGQIKYAATSSFLDSFAQSLADEPIVSISLEFSQELATGAVSTSPIDEASTVGRLLRPGTPSTVTASRSELPKVGRSKSAAKHEAIIPTEDVESALSSWWRELLGLETVGPDDDFFELGGNSLLGLQLFSRVKRDYGVSLKLTTFSEAQTISQLAQIIRSTLHFKGTAQPRPWSPLVPIQPKGNRTPLFVISGLGGNVIKFHTLAFHLGGDQPMFGLLPRGLDGKNPYHTRIEDMAADYVAAIRNKQPDGLYYLAGYSFGGIVAYEVAQQIIAQGGKIGLLGLFDTAEWHYGEKVDRSLRPRERFHVLKGHLQNIAFGAERGTYLSRIVSDKASTIKYRIYRALGRPLPQKIGSIEEMNTYAATAYYPHAYPGKVTLFRSIERTIEQGSDDFLGWGNFAGGGVEVHHVPATHFNILQEPVVQVLAEKLRTCLESSSLPAAG